jgi:hypothetical protein
VAWPDVYHSLDDILELGNLTEMTHRLACGYGGFPSLPEYLRGYALVDRVLEPLEALRDARVRIIAADDDPIIPAADLERVARPSVLEITRTRYGGHCGYYDGVVGPTWVERQILASFGSGE